MAGFPTIFLLSSLLCYGLVSPFAVVHKTDLMKGGPPLKIAAFNVQVFGLKKLSKEDVVKTLVKIIRRYDIIAIQEIRDSSGTAFPSLVVEVNKGLPPDQSYKSIVSDRLGRTSSKEQYGFIYKPSRVTVSDSYHYDDGPEAVGKAKNPQDAFQREPFIVRFSAPDTVVSDFAMVVIHTSPRDAVKEIDHLVDVYDDVVQKWGLEDVIITGDFNAGCSYVTKSEWADIRLRHDPRFTWLIGDDVDTTVAKSDCPYDRFVIAGELMKKSYVPGSAKAFRFDEAYGLNQDETEDVSDHYPIEMELYGRAKDDGKTSDVESLLSITVSDPKAKISDMDKHLMILTEYFDGFKAVGKAKNPQDAFQREPFIVRFSAPDTVVSDFAMVVIHTSPRDAVKEIDHLVDVYDDVVQKWGLEDVIITGDFNAGCSYVTKSEWADIRLRHDPRFTWLIGDDVDTTVAKSDCPYDRFVIAGELMKKSYVPGSAKAFRFDEAYGLNQDETEDVSDHYPIEMELYGRAKDDGKTSDVESLLSITVSDPKAKISDMDKHLMILTEYFDGFKINNLYTDTGDVALLVASKTGLTSDAASKELQLMKEKLNFISGDMFDVARMQITPDDTNLTMKITCNIAKGGCEVTVSEKTL